MQRAWAVRYAQRDARAFSLGAGRCLRRRGGTGGLRRSGDDAVGSAVATTDLRRADERPEYRALTRKAQETGCLPTFTPLPFALLPNPGPSVRRSAMAHFR